MKKLLVILFALGLVFAFTAPVMATDVSFDGSYRIRGWMDSNAPLVENDVPSAYYDQRMRVGVTFQVAEGLKIYTRGDIMDGDWGGGLLRGNTANNIQFDLTYVTFMTAIGQFRAGMMSDGTWGLGFGNLETFEGKIDYTTKVGNWILNAHFIKHDEGDKGHAVADRDYDSYRLATIYMDEALTAGIVYVYGTDANDPNGLNTALAMEPWIKATVHLVAPYFKATLGDLYIEGEAGWAQGEIPLSAAQRGALGFTDDVEIEGLRAYLMAKYNLGSAYVGAFGAYVQGDDPNTTNKIENFLNSGGDWDPMLILFNDTCPTALGTVGGTGTSMTNGTIYQVFAGTAIDKLSLKASLSMAKANENGGTVAAPYISKDYGTEFDLEAAYKIYDNLTYSAGFGYLWAGDYYKGAVAATTVDNTYLLMNKLQVNF